MSEFSLGGALGRRLFGKTHEQSVAEVDRASEEARQRHEERLEQCRIEFENIERLVSEFPEFVVRLHPNEAVFVAVYSPANVIGGRSDPPSSQSYTLTLPSDRLFEAIDDPAMRGMMATWVTVRPADYGRAKLPWSTVTLRNRIRPEVYTLGSRNHENGAEDLDWLAGELLRLEARNLSRDHVFSGRTLKVHCKLYAYWSGKAGPYDHQGIGLSLKRVGIRL